MFQHLIINQIPKVLITQILIQLNIQNLKKGLEELVNFLMMIYLQQILNNNIFPKILITKISIKISKDYQNTTHLATSLQIYYKHKMKNQIIIILIMNNNNKNKKTNKMNNNN